ncbi:MAG: hypothetical protein F6K55_02250 [Moorea sp. SIO4A3]|nr:hypothetical protein [Moorena sp. SIO4A3]
MELREISKLEREEIEEYLFLDEDELYSLIPAYYDKYKGNLFLPSGEKEAGRKEFQNLRQLIYDKVCKEWELCNRIDDPILADNINLVIAIADIITPFLIGFPPFVIASLVVKIGIIKFCDC